MVTFMIPLGLGVELSPCMPCIDPLFIPITDPFGFVGLNSPLRMEDIKFPPPHKLFWGGEEYLGRGNRPAKEPRFFIPDRKRLLAHPISKNHCPSILEGHLSTNPKLSALYLQGPKSNIYVQFQWVNKQLTGISFESEIANKPCN